MKAGWEAELRNLVGILTDYTGDYGTVSGPQTQGERRTVWNAFDGQWCWGDRVCDGTWNDLEVSYQPVQTSAYILFESNRKVRVDGVEHIINYSGNYGGLMLKTAQIQGSNDGTNFTNISSVYSYSNNIQYSKQWNRMESTDKTTAYKYVKVLLNGYYTSSYGSGICIKEMKIMGYFAE